MQYALLLLYGVSISGGFRVFAPYDDPNKADQDGFNQVTKDLAGSFQVHELHSPSELKKE